MAGGRDDARTSRVLRGVAVGAVTLLLCFWAFFGGASNRIDTGIDFDGRTEATYGGGSYTPFGAVGGESTRRSMEPQEMCSWETALEVGALGAAGHRAGAQAAWRRGLAAPPAAASGGRLAAGPRGRKVTALPRY